MRPVFQPFIFVIMPTLTAYQLQFRKRLKRAIRLRATGDQKARRYAQRLMDAIGAGDDAAEVINELNRVYNVDLSTQTILMHSLWENSGQERLLDMLNQSAPGEEVLLTVMIPDGNGGVALPVSTVLD